MMKGSLPNSKGIALGGLKIGYRKTGRSYTVFGPLSALVHSNEMIAVIGRNGVGKSTLLRTIAGLQAPIAGRIEINGRTTDKIGLKDMARLVSFVSTETVQGFQMHVDELIALGRFPYSGWFGKQDSADKTAITDAITQTGISHLLKKSIHEISDGERQKVMIARALAQDTPFIILDEPTAFLDLPSRYEILRILSNLSTRNNKTILFSTHDLSIAMDISDKLWLMSENELHEGSPEDLLINELFRKLFLGSSAIFDPASLQFRFHREFHSKIRIIGGDKLKALTRKAMERIGIGMTDSNTDLVIEINELHGQTQWRLKADNTEREFYSLYELASYLKRRF